jgi:hypothetical protein
VPDDPYGRGQPCVHGYAGGFLSRSTLFSLFYSAYNSDTLSGAWFIHICGHCHSKPDLGFVHVKLARRRRLKTANTGRLRLTRTRIHQMESNSSFTAITPKTEPDSLAPSPSDLEPTQFQRVTPDKPCATTPSHMTSACKQEIANHAHIHKFFRREGF